jgi:class 3 adenylate cyclase
LPPTILQFGRLIFSPFEEVVEAVLNHKSTIDELIGDYIMAVWGAPQPRPDEDARNAMAATWAS